MRHGTAIGRPAPSRVAPCLVATSVHHWVWGAPLPRRGRVPDRSGRPQAERLIEQCAVGVRRHVTSLPEPADLAHAMAIDRTDPPRLAVQLSRARGVRMRRAFRSRLAPCTPGFGKELLLQPIRELHASPWAVLSGDRAPSPAGLTVLADPELATVLLGHEAKLNVDRLWPLQVAEHIRDPLRDLSKHMGARHNRQTKTSLPGPRPGASRPLGAPPCQRFDHTPWPAGIEAEPCGVARQAHRPETRCQFFHEPRLAHTRESRDQQQ